jgi:hypothetical protein
MSVNKGLALKDKEKPKKIIQNMLFILRIR